MEKTYSRLSGTINAQLRRVLSVGAKSARYLLGRVGMDTSAEQMNDVDLLARYGLIGDDAPSFTSWVDLLNYLEQYGATRHPEDEPDFEAIAHTIWSRLQTE